MIPLSILDLAPIVEGATAADALRHTLDLARHAEAWATPLLAGRTPQHGRRGQLGHRSAGRLQAAATQRSIRVGSGGIMLPNHAPLMVAEAFGTLATLYPGRIDLGLGRAPGTDMLTARAPCAGTSPAPTKTFPQDVLELQAYLGDAGPGEAVRAIPGSAPRCRSDPGSSLYGAGWRPTWACPTPRLTAPEQLDAGAGGLPRHLPPFSRMAEAACHGGRERDRRRHR